ncbi:hypothetical protein NEFER03_1164 [Nematocida sp. LUAm3]|nr:hypothetical protein NEFER03_1164 [Nematocida sp. LUAm3]KAI5175773.1 hypothetical protein NEFER02_1642 [Nematocida sp. LUAm2]KAI5178269.1 hypothetical protein NEFER01_1436 [Nematocida sp. LUAm1]
MVHKYIFLGILLILLNGVFSADLTTGNGAEYSIEPNEKKKEYFLQEKILQVRVGQEVYGCPFALFLLSSEEPNPTYSATKQAPGENASSVALVFKRNDQNVMQAQTTAQEKEIGAFSVSLEKIGLEPNVKAFGFFVVNKKNN